MKQVTKESFNWTFARKQKAHKYIAIDGTEFNSRSQCSKYEKKIETHRSFYKHCLIKGIYTKKDLKKIYDDYEKNKESWQKEGGQVWLDYCAGQFGLALVLGYEKEK